MATMYELLSERPHTVPGRGMSHTAQWDDTEIQSREYTLPVRKNQRTKINRPRRKKAIEQQDEQKDQEHNHRRRPTLKSVVGLITQTIRAKNIVEKRNKLFKQLDSDDDGETGHHEQELYDETKSIGSSILRPEPLIDMSQDEIDRVKKVYERQCKKSGVIPMGLFLRQLGSSTLDLHFNTVGDTGLRALSIPIAMCPGLQKVNLSNSNIGDIGVSYLVEAIMENEELKDLDLSYNKITANGGKGICDYIQRSKTIRALTLSGNPLGDHCAPYLAEALQNSVGLLGTLQVSDCGFAVEGGRLIGPAIGVNDTLTELDLSWNHIRLTGAVAIANGLKVNDTLQKLDISWNGFAFDGVAAIGRALAENNSLTDLDLSNNRLFDKGIYKLIGGLKLNEGLQILRVDKNPITPDGATGLLQAVIENPNTAMRRIELQGVPVKEAFINKLAELREIHSDFQAIHAFQTDTTERKTGMDLLLEYLKESGKTPNDIFGISDVGGPMWMNKFAFIEQVKEAKTPLAEFQIIEIANICERKDGSVVNLGYIFQKWEQYIEEQKTAS